MVYNISKNLYLKCKKFAIERIKGSSSLYSYRGEMKKDKMIEDVIVGTLGEWAVYDYLVNQGYECSEPDMKIYAKNRKSFSADLSVDDVEIHVKSQGIESVNKYGNSWLFQRHDRLVSSPGDLELLAFTNVDLESKTVNILGFCWASDVVYDECKVPFYRKTKVAIYVDQIKDFLIEC